jgi:hypothetical protein
MYNKDVSNDLSLIKNPSRTNKEEDKHSCKLVLVVAMGLLAILPTIFEEGRSGLSPWFVTRVSWIGSLAESSLDDARLMKT